MGMVKSLENNCTSDKKIEKLLENDSCYSITPFYFVYNSELFDELENYMLNNIENYLCKIKNIIFKIITYYDDVEISLSEFPKEGEFKYKEYELTNIPIHSYKLIDDVITYIAKMDITKINVFFKKENMLFHIGGYFSFYVFGENEEFLNFLKIHVQSEGLFIFKRQF